MSEPTNLERLADDWERLLALFGAARESIHCAFADLVRAYATPDRHYHTLEHVRHVLDTITALRDQARDLVAIELAAWFHDAVYDPRARDNEERSAAYAATMLPGLQVPAQSLAAVTPMILATKTHQSPAGDSDGRILLDADLAILGTESADYARYAQAIRLEYAWVPEEQYRSGRTQVLQHFLQRERIYLTEPMFEALEARARQNLRGEIQALARKTPSQEP